MKLPQLFNPYQEKRNRYLLAFSLVWSMTFLYLALVSIDEAYCFALIAALPVMLYTDKPMRFSVWHYVLFAMTVWMLISGFVNMNFADGTYYYPGESDRVEHTAGGYGLGYTVTNVCTWWLVIAYSSRAVTKKELRFLADVYVNIAALASIFMFASNLDVSAWGEISRGEIPFLGATLNANFMPYLILPMIVICFFRVCVSMRWEELLKALLGIMVLLICRSRGGLVAAFAALFLLSLYVVIYIRKNKSGYVRIGTILGLWISLSAAMIICKKFAPELYEYWFRVESGNSGRDLLWKEAMELLVTPSDVLFGKGWGYYYYIHQGDMTALYGLHNFFVQYFFNSGYPAAILGGAAFVLYLIRTHDLFGFALMSVMAVHMGVENGLTPACLYTMIWIFAAVRAQENTVGRRHIAALVLNEGDAEFFESDWLSPLKNKFFNLLAVH